MSCSASGRSPPAGASDIPGLEVAGRIAAVDEADPAGRWRIGDQVCALVAGGGYAEYCVAPASQCLPFPAGIDPVAAAAIPETTFTVWTNLFQRAQLRRGERVLLHGGTSGIGTTAIQLAHASGATVFTTAGSDTKCDACVRLGADVAINYRREDFVEVVREATSGAGVHAILDIVGGDYVARNLRCLGLDGRLVQIGLLGGSRGEVDFGLVLRHRLTIIGINLARPVGCRKGGDRNGCRASRVAVACGPNVRPGDRPDLSTGGRGRCSPTNGVRRSRREDRAHGGTPVSCQLECPHLEARAWRATPQAIAAATAAPTMTFGSGSGGSLTIPRSSLIAGSIA